MYPGECQAPRRVQCKMIPETSMSNVSRRVQCQTYPEDFSVKCIPESSMCPGEFKCIPDNSMRPGEFNVKCIPKFVFSKQQQHIQECSLNKSNRSKNSSHFQQVHKMATNVATHKSSCKFLVSGFGVAQVVFKQK